MSRHKHFHLEADIERRKWQNPEAILTEIGLRPGMSFVDVGCGNGFFILPAAEMVGKTGKVIGIDIDSKWLQILQQKALEKSLRNLEIILGRAEETVPVRKSADVVFYGMVLHDFDDPDKVLANAKIMLKKGGTLADLDWVKEETPVGPPVEIRFNEQKASSIIERHGFKVVSATKSNPYHYLILALLDT